MLFDTRSVFPTSKNLSEVDWKNKLKYTHHDQMVSWSMAYSTAIRIARYKYINFDTLKSVRRL